MAKFIPREKLGKKARRALDAQKRATWDFSPVTRKVENKKHYDRKKLSPARYDGPGRGYPFAPAFEGGQAAQAPAPCGHPA